MKLTWVCWSFVAGMSLLSALTAFRHDHSVQVAPVNMGTHEVDMAELNASARSLLADYLERPLVNPNLPYRPRITFRNQAEQDAFWADSARFLTTHKPIDFKD